MIKTTARTSLAAKPGVKAAAADPHAGAPSLPIPADRIFPAYGYMNELWMWDVRTRRVPAGFLIAGRPVSASEWKQYLDAETHALGDFLWPRYNATSHEWYGDATSHMLLLTEADLALMAEFRLLLQQAPSVVATPLEATHQSLFELEDESPPGTPLYPTLDAYLPKLPTEALAALKTSIKTMSREFGPAPLRYKEYFQRPRPYQVSFALGKAFHYEFAHSAVSPSFPSGHCLQGLVRHTAAYLAHWQTLSHIPFAIERLAQHAVDYGDRRVIAGVHYPSDNIGSWYVALRLCDGLYGQAGQYAKDFMVKAIKSSTLFIALEKSAAVTGSIYAGPFARLRAEMVRPADSQED